MWQEYTFLLIMSEKNNIKATRSEIFALLQQILSEMTDNRVEDIREDSLVYNELNLTEFDLQRIIKEIGSKIEINTEELSQTIEENDEISTVADVLDLIVDEKELG